MPICSISANPLIFSSAGGHVHVRSKSRRLAGVVIVIITTCILRLVACTRASCSTLCIGILLFPLPNEASADHRFLLPHSPSTMAPLRANSPQSPTSPRRSKTAIPPGFRAVPRPKPKPIADMTLRELHDHYDRNERLLHSS